MSESAETVPMHGPVGTAPLNESWRPIKVVVLDAEDLSDISLESRYQALWALIRERGRPRGLIKIGSGPAASLRDRLLDAVNALPPASSVEAPRIPEGEQCPRVSVVVCTAGKRLAELRQCIASITACEYPDFEIILVDNRELSAEPLGISGCRIVHEPRPGLSAARNKGLEEAQGEIVAFTDDDVIVEPDWIVAIVARMMTHPDEVCVTGIAIPSELETAAQVALEDYYGGFTPQIFEPVSHRLLNPKGTGGFFAETMVTATANDGKVIRTFSLYATGSFGGGVNMGFKTDVLREIGGFDVALGAGAPAQGGEELDVFLRLAWLGYALGFEPAAVVRHKHRRDEASLRKQIGGYGLGWGALLFASVLRDRGHVGRMLRVAPRGLWSLAVGYADKLRHRDRPVGDVRVPNGYRTDQTLIKELARLELRGIPLGPLAYLRGRLR